MATNIPTKIQTHILESWYNGKTFKGCLVGAGWTPNRGSSQFRSELTAHEVSGTNWPAGGVTVSLVVSEVAAAHQSIVTLQAFTVADVTIATPARYLVVYHSTGNPATDRIVRWHDLGGLVTWTAQPFQFDASDLVITVGADR